MNPFDEHGDFRSGAGAGGLRRAAVRGAGITVLSQSVCFAIQIIATFVLARLLTPADFGLVTIVTTFSLLLMNVGFNGLTEAVVQREDMDHGLATNLFWINFGIGVVLTVAFAASGPLLARLYGDDRVASVVIAMSATIVLSSASVMHLALLKRALQFSRVSANDVIARATSVIVAIAIGWTVRDYRALVAGAIVLPLATAVGAWARCRWIPGLPRRRTGTGSMVRFAMHTYGHFAANYCTRNLDNFLVGWFFGPQSLGFYKKAYDLCVLPVAQLSDPFNAVSVPVLSRLASDPERRKRYVIRALSTLAFVGMGLGGCLSLAGKDLIRVLLGPQWQESGRIFTFFAPGVGAMLLYLTYASVHLSVGRADRLFRWAILEFAIIGSLFVVALPWGPVGVASAWVASSWVLTLPALWYAGTPAGLGVTPILGALWRYVIAAPIAVAGCLVIVQRFPALMTGAEWLDAFNRTVTLSSLFGVLYFAAVILLHRGNAPLRDFSSLVRDMLPTSRRRASADAAHAERPLAQCTTLKFTGVEGTVE